MKGTLCSTFIVAMLLVIKPGLKPWICKISANEKQCCFCNVFSYGLRLFSVMHWKGTHPVLLWKGLIQFDDAYKQGKSEGFESCDRPIVRKRPIWVKIGDVLSRVTLKFDGWPWKTIGHLFFAVSSFVQHFIAIGEFKLELQSGNAQFGSKSTIFRAV